MQRHKWHITPTEVKGVSDVEDGRRLEGGERTAVEGLLTSRVQKSGVKPQKSQDWLKYHGILKKQ